MWRCDRRAIRHCAAKSTPCLKGKVSPSCPTNGTCISPSRPARSPWTVSPWNSWTPAPPQPARCHLWRSSPMINQKSVTGKSCVIHHQTCYVCIAFIVTRLHVLQAAGGYQFGFDKKFVWKGKHFWKLLIESQCVCISGRSPNLRFTTAPADSVRGIWMIRNWQASCVFFSFVNWLEGFLFIYLSVSLFNNDTEELKTLSSKSFFHNCVFFICASLQSVHFCQLPLELVVVTSMLLLELNLE